MPPEAGEPDVQWTPSGVRLSRRVSRAGDLDDHPLPGVEQAMARYQSDPSPETLRAVAVESAPWNFLGHRVAKGAEILGRMPYNTRATQWSDANFDRSYQLAWWPTMFPTLIVSGSADRIVAQSLWQAERFHTRNVLWRVITDAGHFPWIEQPGAVRDAFTEVAQRISGLRNTE